jgi:hypothetical protein
MELKIRTILKRAFFGNNLAIKINFNAQSKIPFRYQRYTLSGICLKYLIF